MAGPRRRLLSHDEVSGRAGANAGHPDLVQVGSLYDVAVGIFAAGPRLLSRRGHFPDRQIRARSHRDSSRGDCLCRSPLGRHEVALALVGYVYLVALTYGFTHVFSGLGAFTQIGALVGTIMVAN